MPITHDRLEALTEAALQVLDAYNALRRTINAQHAAAIQRMSADSDARWDIAMGEVYAIARHSAPSLEVAELLGKERAKLLANRHAANRAKHRMRELRARRGQSTPAPDHAFNPRYGQPHHHQPAYVAKPTFAPTPEPNQSFSPGVQLGMQPDEFGQAPEPNPDFGSGIFGQSPSADSPIIGQPLPDCADIDAIMNDPTMSLDEKYAAMERLAQSDREPK